MALAGAGPVVAGCGDAPATAGRTPASFQNVLREARGRQVRFWMFGGDDRVNAFVDGRVAPAARRLGVRLVRVPVADTADAMRRVVAQRRAGRASGGAVDLIWINGENFAAGQRAGLWLRNWARALPNARYLDPRDPTISRDFQVPVDGQESPWMRAAFIYAYDTARTRVPPRTFDQLLRWARAHPGRFTYPAPPDFTGSAFVREVVRTRGADAYLRALKPFMYRHAEAMPTSEAELDALFGNGQVDLAMSYDASFVAAEVERGVFPRTARPFLLGGGALANVSFVAIPADAAHVAGAQVVADLLLSPRLQASMADPRVLGQPSVLDLDRLPERERRLFDRARSGPYLLRDLGRPRGELPAREVEPLERRWRREVLRGSG